VDGLLDDGHASLEELDGFLRLARFRVDASEAVVDVVALRRSERLVLESRFEELDGLGVLAPLRGEGRECDAGA
jgi:hypothetical protein